MRVPSQPLMQSLLSQSQAPAAPRRASGFFRFGGPSGYPEELIAQPTSVWIVTYAIQPFSRRLGVPTHLVNGAFLCRILVIPKVGSASLTRPCLQDHTHSWMTTLCTAAGTEFFCSFCGKRKGDAKDWLLGFEGMTVKNVVMKYTINLLRKWDEGRASEPSAVHFCSIACQDQYLSRNYGDDTWAA